MKVGDLVKDNHPNCVGAERIGVIIERVSHYRRIGFNNKLFKVLWHNGTIGKNVWDYDLKVVDESR